MLASTLLTQHIRLNHHSIKQLISKTHFFDCILAQGVEVLEVKLPTKQRES